MYTQEQVNQLITDVVANLGDQGKVSELLQDFRTDYTQTLTDYESLTTEKETLLNNNKSLVNVNNKMMNQLGDISFLGKGGKGKEKIDEEQGTEETEEIEIFDKNGELI